MDDYVCPDPIKSFDVKLRKNMEWISVKKRLPETHKIVLAWEGSIIILGFIDDFINGEPCWYDGEWIELEDVSHWMPLPGKPHE